MEGEVCYVGGMSMVIDYGIGAGADSIMLVSTPEVKI